MPFLRRRPLLRAAAVGGGAYAYGKHRERQQQEQQEGAYYEGQQSVAPQVAPAPAAPAAAPVAGGLSDADMQRLGDLGKLHDQGILTDEEFAQEKRKILGI